MGRVIKEDKVTVKHVRFSDSTLDESWSSMDPSEVSNEVRRMLGIYRFVNPHELEEKADLRLAGLYDRMILPEHIAAYHKVLSPAFWAERQRAWAGTSGPTKEMMYWLSLDELLGKAIPLIDLVTSGKVHIEQRECNGKTRHLAVCSDGPALVCEITEEAFETLTKTDIINKRRKESKSRETQKVKGAEVRNRLLRVSREIGMNARVSYFDGQSVKGSLQIQGSGSSLIPITFSCDAQEGIQINVNERFANYPQVTRSIEKLERCLRDLGVPGSFLGVRVQT